MKIKTLFLVGIFFTAGAFMGHKYMPGEKGVEKISYTEKYKSGFVDIDKNGLDDRIQRKIIESGGRYCWWDLQGFVDENKNGMDDRDESRYIFPSLKHRKLRGFRENVREGIFK